MRDFLSFVLRGAWGGVAFVLALSILTFGSIGAFFFLSPVFLLYSLSPGVIVGLVLWFVAAKAKEALRPGIRFAIGTGTVAVIILPMWLYQAASSIRSGYVYGFDLPSMLMRIAVFSAGIGGLAGLACPASREQINQQSRLTYRERVQLYEAAEQEAKQARERIASAGGVRNQPQ